MPGLPLVVHETTCNRPRIADQMCRLESRGQLTAEEAVAAEESLSAYCKPVELYNILQRRALCNPSFLQRCLSYKIQARHKRRIQMTVSLSSGLNDGLSQNIFPLHILVARPIRDATTAEFLEYAAVYRVSQAFMLTAFSELGRRGRTEATFIIPEIQKLSLDSRSGDLTIIFFSQGVVNGFSTENFPLKDPKREGHCLWGKFLVTSLSSSPEKSASLSLGHRVEMLSPIDMNGSIFEPNFLNQGNCLGFRIPPSMESQNPIFQAKANISAQEVGARERNPYDSYTYDDVPTIALPHIIRLRSGNVIFNYRYFNNTLQKTEVTEDFTCPFCLERCASFKGVRYHLTSCHDLFNYEFWVTEEYQAVNVSVKADMWRCEIVADGVDPKLQTFFYCSRRKRRRRQTDSQNINDVHSDVKLDSPEMARDNSQEDGGSNKDEKSPTACPTDNHCQIERRNCESDVSESHFNLEQAGNVSSPKNNTLCASSALMPVSNDCVLPSERNAGSSAMLQFAKTSRLSVDRIDPRNRASLQKRRFFHSHRAQPMALEQVLSDRDSEDEVDDGIADFEDRRMLDDFVDVTKDEKQIMHIWNSFVRKQRVLADGHIPWACEAFTMLHGRTFVQSPALLWCWRLFMVKLWNHSLLDARTMNNCNTILQTLKREDTSDPKES